MRIIAWCVAAIVCVSSMGYAQEGVITTFKFRDTDIRLALQAIAAKAVKDGKKINILVAPDIKGLVNVELENVDWMMALDAVLKTYNYGFEWAGKNIILVDTLDNLAEKRKKGAEAKVAEPLDTKVFTLSFAKVDDIRATVQGIISSRGRMIADTRTNTLVITDAQSNMPAIEEALNALDMITPQVLIEAKVVETDFDVANKLGLRWNLGSSSAGSASTVASGTGTSYIGPFTKTAGSKYINGATTALTRPFTYGTLDASSFSVALQLLFEDSHTKILSQPSITTMDNNTANIEVVREDPLPNYTYNSETGSWEISGYEWKKYGVSLEVTPQINKEEFVTLVIKPRINEKYSDKQFSSAQSGATAEIPIIDTQTVNTKVMVRNGETLVIGGLIRDKTTETVSKVPIFGDIPVLGYFFKHKNKVTVQKNLIIFITPHIVTPNRPMAKKPAEGQAEEKAVEAEKTPVDEYIAAPGA